jgi:hypothetical protein
VFEAIDEIHQDRISKLGLRTLLTDTMMKSPSDQARLAGEILKFATDDL